VTSGFDERSSKAFPSSSLAGIALVVDDNPVNLGVLSDLLDRAGWQVSVAKSGQQALDRVRFLRPDLILLDVMMPPGIDGFETCRQLKANPEIANIPVIFMTALSEVSNKVKGLEIGAVDYITKPFQQEEVLARANTHLRLHRLQQQVRNQNVQLEQTVKARTQELETAIETLKSTQLQLVQTEKMSSLGQLVAGIAHEINNPINFIYGNLSYAEDYMNQLLEAIAAYREVARSAAPETLDGIIDESELEFTEEDFPKLLSSMHTGADRIRAIVSGLRTFSRIDESPCKAIDLHESIDSTLTILGSRLKARSDRPEIEVVRDFGELGLVECFSGEINQVVLNLVGNAIDAIESHHQDLSETDEVAAPGKIAISTRLESPDTAYIAIADNGSGMSETTRQKIFDPFFTTKPVGKGTGLGLALSYSIVTEKHGGTLSCTSELGSGTTFEIRLPVRLPPDCGYSPTTTP